MARLGVAVVGVGSMGRRHAENVRKFPELRLVAVADARPDTARSVADELGCPFWTTDPDAALGHPDCQAAIIATSAGTHADLIELAAGRRRDVLCEKPITLSIEDAQRALHAAEAAHIRLQVGFMRRYDRGYAAAKQAIDAGRIGRPLIFKAIARDRDPGPPSAPGAPSSGGIFVDSAVHDFDLARWLMADEVSEVSALTASLSDATGPANDPDTGLVNLRFKRGTAGAVEVYTQARYGYDIRTEVVGSEGTIQVGQGQDRPFSLLRPDGVTVDFVGGYLERFAAAYELELRDWARRMLGDQPPAVTAEDGIRALAIALAAKQAAATGRRVAVAP